MATKKAGGSAKNLNDSLPKYLGIKLGNGEHANIGDIIVRQRGTKMMPGKNVGTGKDYTLFAMKEGIVHFKNKRHINFDGSTVQKKIVNVEEK
ncbi:MAG: 50S ribosomal protein L27 [Patescibacteria group bacterium]